MRKKRAIVSKGPQQEDFKEEMRSLNTQENDLEAFFKGLGAEIPPLDMLQRAVQNDIIHSFKPTSTKEIYEKIGKGICELCDEYVAEAEMGEQECGHKACSLLILHQDMEKESMAFVFHKEEKEDDQEGSAKAADMGQKLREPNICEDQLLNQKLKNQEEVEGKIDLKFKEEIKDICEEPITVLEENLKGKEEYPNMVEEEKKIMCKLGKTLLQQNKEKGYKKNGMTLGKRVIKKKPGMGKEKVKIKKKSRMYMRKRRIKKNKGTMEKHNNGIKKIRRKVQERRSKKRERNLDAHDGGSGGGPGRRRRKKTKAATTMKGPATGENLESIADISDVVEGFEKSLRKEKGVDRNIQCIGQSKQEATEINGWFVGCGKKYRGACPDLGRNRNSELVAVFAEKGKKKKQKGNGKWTVAAGKLRRLIVKPADDVDLGWYAGKRMEEGKEVTVEKTGRLTGERKKWEWKADDVKKVGEIGRLTGIWRPLTGCGVKTWESEFDFLDVSEIEGGKRDKKQEKRIQIGFTFENIDDIS